MREGYVYIDSVVFPTLLAISEQEQQQGLMGVEWCPPTMTFVYASPKVNKFWMYNTPSPLDIIFCYNNKVTEICYGEPFSTRALGFDMPSDLIIELPFGTAMSSNIKLGHKAGIISPSKYELKNILK